MFKEQMILALQRHEVGTGNASSKLAASLEWNNEVAPHMHNQRRRLHFGKKIGDIDISHDIEVSRGAVGGGRSALQLVKTISLLVRCPWNEKVS
jgi:hypothetical protein